MAASPGRQQIRGLFGLYQDERRREERTKGALRSLQQNSDEVLRSKMRLIEKVLDLKVKDELALLRDATNVALAETSAETVRRRARERIQRDLEHRIPEAKDKWGDHFVSHLDDMAERPDDAERQRVVQAVGEALAPQLRRLKETRDAAREAAADGTQAITARECDRVLAEGQAALSDARQDRAAEGHEDRRRRVTEAEGRLLKPREVTATQLSELLRCEPDPSWYNCPIGRSEAAISDWRTLIYRQRAEEERLILERSGRLNEMEAQHEELQAEVDQLTQRVQALQEELDTKEREIDEMRAAQVPGTGRWARDLLDLEQSVEFQGEEELRLKRDYESVAAATGTIDADRRMLNEKVHDELAELARLQDQYRQLVDKIEEQLVQAKEQILAVRHENLENTRRVNDLRWKAWSGSDEAQDRKRALRERLNQTISQLAIEERLQMMIEAKIQLKDEEMDQIQRDQQRALEGARAELARVRLDQEQIAAQNTALIDRLADLKTGVSWASQEARAPLKSEQQLKEEIKALTKQWSQMLVDTAQQTSETRAKTMMNMEENELLLDRMGHIVVINRALEREGVDSETSTTAQLAQVANRLYDDLSRASFREAKLNQLLRVFREAQRRRHDGEFVAQITGPRPQSRQQRRGRREARQRAWLAREMARSNVSLQSAYPSPPPGVQAPRAPLSTEPTSAAGASPGRFERPSPAPGGTEPTPEQQHRLRVINFIKNEIQPLYDAEQITKRRFIDIVARASSAYLESRPVTPALTLEDQQWLQRKIQEVITLQDEARSRRRAAREQRERSAASAAAVSPPRPP